MANIIALDQENHGIAVVINGGDTFEIQRVEDLRLPPGGGLIIGDGNVWGVANDLSVSQFVFPSAQAREVFVAAAAAQGYKCRSVSNKYARTQQLKRSYNAVDAVRGLYEEAERLVSESGRFDAGKPIRESRGDVSFGKRTEVTVDFLRLQNAGGYESPFVQKGIEIAWNALDAQGKKLFNLQMRNPVCTSPNRLTAVLVCTHNPEDGKRREYQDRPWEMRFITRNILCLNGTMMGTGVRSPGSPMRAVLRVLGRRWGDKVNSTERSQTDKYIRVLVREFQKHNYIG